MRRKRPRVGLTLRRTRPKLRKRPIMANTAAARAESRLRIVSAAKQRANSTTADTAEIKAKSAVKRAKDASKRAQDVADAKKALEAAKARLP
jgi:hypothetical protein